MKQTETATDRLFRWSNEAEEAVRVKCTNVVGFRRVLQVYGNYWGTNNVKDWKATAKIEIINSVGGVVDTNVPFAFIVVGGEISAYEDSDAEFRAWQEQLDKRERERAEADKISQRSSLVVSICTQEPYTWTFKAGGRITAEFVSAGETSVLIRRQEGGDILNPVYKTYTIPLTDLIQSDQELIKQAADLQRRTKSL